MKKERYIVNSLGRRRGESIPLLMKLLYSSRILGFVFASSAQVPSLRDIITKRMDMKMGRLTSIRCDTK